MTSYSIEHAKSSRSSCKKCKEKILKDDLRIGAESTGGDYNLVSWYHTKCFVVPRKLVKEGVTAETFVTDMLQDNTNDSSLETLQDEIIADIEYTAPRGSKHLTSPDGGKNPPSTLAATLKERLATLRDEADEPPSKKVKASNDDEEQAKLDVYATIEKYKNDQLKDMLRWNRQMLSGTKDMLLARVIDGHLHGRLGRCPFCTKGRLQVQDESALTAICKGYYDEDLGTRIPCTFQCPLSDAPRNHPWFAEKPSEQDEEDMDRMDEAIKNGLAPPSSTNKGVSSSSGGDDAASQLVQKAEAVDWKCQNKAGIQAATQALLDICIAGNVDIPPANKAKMAIGKIVASHKSATPGEVMQVIIETFGFAAQKKEAAQKKTDAILSLCGHPANVAIMEVMLELGELYFKENNTNAGLSYKKVAEAIKGLDYEVTEDNAKGLGKGKTKVVGIGKGSADKIYEFLTTGTIEKLEEKRAGAS